MLGWADPNPLAATSSLSPPYSPDSSSRFHHAGYKPGLELWGQRNMERGFCRDIGGEESVQETTAEREERRVEMDLWARPGKPPDISSLWLRASLGLRGPVVSVGPAEPTDLLLVLIRVHSSAVRGYNVFTLSAPARSGRSPSTWSLPDFCLFLSTFLSLPFLLLSVFLLSSLFFNHLFASLSLSSSRLAFPGPPLCGSGCKTHTTKAVSSHVWLWPWFCIYITPALSLPCLCVPC